MEKTLGGLYNENGVLYDRQSLWPCRSSVGVHCYTFHTSARETYDMWLPARWGGLFRTLVQWKCVSCSHWWYLFSAFVPRTILRKWLACSLETGLDLWHCTWKEQWATKVSVWACSTDHPPYIDMPCSLPWENWHGHLSLTFEPCAQFLPNKLSDVWNKVANPMCHRQVSVS